MYSYTYFNYLKPYAFQPATGPVTKRAQPAPYPIASLEGYEAAQLTRMILLVTYTVCKNVIWFGSHLFTRRRRDGHVVGGERARRRETDEF